MIICGFPGVGKSIMAQTSRWIDLESTPFQKDFETYARVAKHMSENGYNVMVSTHPELLNQFEKIGVLYTVVVPPLEEKIEYKKRYDARGNTQQFIEYVTENWDQWIENIVNHKSELRTVVILPIGGGISTEEIFK